MNDFNLHQKEASIVLVGSFNPAIFHPEWLSKHGLIPDDDLDMANVEFVNHDLSKFSLAWLSFEVIRNKLVASTIDPSKFEPLRDLIISVFDILDHTPIKNMGMNLNVDYAIEKEEVWHKIGDILAPKEVWKKTLPEGRIGLTRISVQTERNDDLKGLINVTLSPIEMKNYGVRVNINNHINIEEDEQGLTPSNILSEYWDNTIENSLEIANKTIQGAIES